MISAVDLQEMKLHERITSDDGSMQVVRVMNGWVYRFFETYCDASNNICHSHTCIFVPMS